MVASVSNAFITMFDSEVHQAYQAQRQLAGLTRERTGVVGSSVKFQKLSKGSASIRSPLTDVVPMSLTWSNVSAQLIDYIAADYTDLFHAPKVNIQEKSELVQSVSGAIARRIDQVTIDALVAASGTGAVANTIQEDGSSGSANGLNTGMIRAAKKTLDAKNVPPSDRTLLVHANSLSNLLGKTSVQSSDFNSIKALVNGDLDTWLGFKIITIGDRPDEGGLAIDGSSDRVCYAFHKSSVGVGIGMNQTSRIDWVAEKTSWLVASMFSGGGIAIDADGIVKITTRE